MSLQLGPSGGLRTWTADEINLREMFQDRAAFVVRNTLLSLNPAWRIERCEGSILMPASSIGSAYLDDVFFTNHSAADDLLVLRPETTQSSYDYARHLKGRLPLCVWQSGISSRRETSDGATAAKLRFNSFWQLEFQCIYGPTTKADYRGSLIGAISREIERATMSDTRVVPSDRLPSYSLSTLDIEVFYNDRWTEMASCSIRNDYDDENTVCEIAIGLDRVATVAAAC